MLGGDLGFKIIHGTICSQRVRHFTVLEKIFWAFESEAMPYDNYKNHFLTKGWWIFCFKTGLAIFRWQLFYDSYFFFHLCRLFITSSVEYKLVQKSIFIFVVHPIAAFAGNRCFAGWSLRDSLRFYSLCVRTPSWLSLAINRMILRWVFPNARENVGLLGITRVGSRRVVQISAGFMIFFSILGPGFSTLRFIISAPPCARRLCLMTRSAPLLQENLGPFLHQFRSLFLLRCTACSSALWVSNIDFDWLQIEITLFSACNDAIFLWNLAASVGLSFLQFTNMNSMRNLIITGLSLFLGISVPQFFTDSFVSSGHGPVHTRSGWVSFLKLTLFSLSWKQLPFPFLARPSGSSQPSWLVLLLKISFFCLGLAGSSMGSWTRSSCRRRPSAWWWPSSWTTPWRWRSPRRTEGCPGGWSSGPSEETTGTKSSTPCPSTSTGSSRRHSRPSWTRLTHHPAVPPPFFCHTEPARRGVRPRPLGLIIVGFWASQTVAAAHNFIFLCLFELIC